MYLDCLNCQKLGDSCDGPNFLALTAPQLLDWCKQRKQKLGITNAKLAELANTPKGTIDRIFSGSYLDYRYETIRPILRVLVGCKTWGENPCDTPEPTADPLMAEKLAQQTEALRLMKKENYRLTHELELERQHRVDTEEVRKQTTETLQIMREQLRSRRTAVIALTIAVGICFALIIIALIVDRMNGDMGFFWLD